MMFPLRVGLMVTDGLRASTGNNDDRKHKIPRRRFQSGRFFTWESARRSQKKMADRDVAHGAIDDQEDAWGDDRAERSGAGAKRDGKVLLLLMSFEHRDH